jgi:hypothetical protein
MPRGGARVGACTPRGSKVNECRPLAASIAIGLAALCWGVVRADAKMSNFQRCFLRLFHCRTRRRKAHIVVERGRIMPYALKPLLMVGARAARRLRLAKDGRVGVTAALPRSPPC